MNGMNKHGLPRYIPEGVKREIRQRCGFGCVVCGLGFYDYEHFDPDFADATEHNPKGMTLLCSQCNQKRARGRLSAETVAKANANPKCLEKGFASEFFDFHHEPITIFMAGNCFRDCEHLIVIGETPILSVNPPEEEFGPVLLSGFFCNEKGETVLRIDNNQIVLNSSNWDVECCGPMITIRNGLGDIALSLEMNPPKGISIKRLNMVYNGLHIRCIERKLELSYDGKEWDTFVGFDANGCLAALRF